MTPKEKNDVLVRLGGSAKNTLETERKKLRLSQSAYIEMLIEGTLPGRMEKQIEELRKELLEKFEEIKK